MSSFFANVRKPFHKKGFFFIYLVLLLVFSALWWYFTDISIMLGNYGMLHTYMDIALSFSMIVFFPLFIVGVLYRWFTFGKREAMNKKNSLGTLGGITATIISGSSCCGLTLASYFGLIPLMAFLPYDGLEIKLVATLGLFVALVSLFRNLEVCTISTKVLGSKVLK